MSSDRCEVTTNPPSYLKVLLDDYSKTGTLKMVYKKGPLLTPKLKKSSTSSDITGNDSFSSNNNDLDLTGNPLQVSLEEGNETEQIIEICSKEKPLPWTAEESQYHPISLDEARSYLNSFLASKPKNAKPIYCICDGSDARKTVMMGTEKSGNAWVSSLVTVLPCSREPDAVTLSLIEAYYEKKPMNFTLKKKSKKIYYPHGYDLKNCISPQHAEINTSFAVEVSCDDNLEEINQNSHFALTLQVICGHTLSPLHEEIWKDLDLLHLLLGIGNEKMKLHEDTVISESGLSQMDSMDNICGDLEKIVQGSTHFRLTSQWAFDIKDLRSLCVHEKLWNILKNCATLRDVKECLVKFFEIVANLESPPDFKIPDSDKSMIVEFIKMLVSGKMAVPTLNLSHSLQLLIDLGLEKVKNDYLAIVNHFYPLGKEEIVRKWSDLCTQSENGDVNNANVLKRRGSRLTINSSTVIGNPSSNSRKLSYLDCVHVFVEFMFAWHEHLTWSQKEECRDRVSEELFKLYVAQGWKIKNITHLPRVYEFSYKCPSSMHTALKPELRPVASVIQMESISKTSEFYYNFYISRHPIFPPCVFDDYDISQCDPDGDVYYVTALRKHVVKH